MSAIVNYEWFLGLQLMAAMLEVDLHVLNRYIMRDQLGTTDKAEPESVPLVKLAAEQIRMLFDNVMFYDGKAPATC